KVVLNQADKILYLSKFSEKIIKKEYPEFEKKAEHLTAGIPKNMFEPNFERDFNKNLFFTVRRLTPRMGLENLIKAARVLDMKELDFKVEIAGTGHIEQRLKNLIEVYQLKNKVKLLGKISDEELEKKYHEASAFILPTTGLEGLGIATLEALFSGCPVLGTPAGATPELLEPINRSLVFSEIDYQSIAKKIEWYIRLDNEKKEEFSKKGYNFVSENFTAEKMNAQLAAICKSLLE
ncbi:glycosyltransferase family 4 protein, partial [Patescibacteria group bacterium]|nr:glycosyltransferase family 4 protein [Patescibacteria group bacterium]